MTFQSNSGVGAVIGQQPLKQQLNYALSTDVAALSLVSGTPVDVVANQSFSLDNSTSWSEFNLFGHIFVTDPSNSAEVILQLVIDSGGVPTTLKIGSVYAFVINTDVTIPLTGSRWAQNLASGAHTVKLQAISSFSTTKLYCRALSSGIYEYLGLVIMEHKVLS